MLRLRDDFTSMAVQVPLIGRGPTYGPAWADGTPTTNGQWGSDTNTPGNPGRLSYADFDPLSAGAYTDKAGVGGRFYGIAAGPPMGSRDQWAMFDIVDSSTATGFRFGTILRYDSAAQTGFIFSFGGDLYVIRRLAGNLDWTASPTDPAVAVASAGLILSAAPTRIMCSASGSSLEIRVGNAGEAYESMRARSPSASASDASLSTQIGRAGLVGFSTSSLHATQYLQNFTCGDFTSPVRSAG